MSRVLVIVMALTVALTVGAVPAGAQPEAAAQPDAPQDVKQLGAFADFNGDGLRDLAVGAPTENFGGTVDAGAVSIFLGTGTGLSSISQTLVQDNPEAGDQFGAVLAARDFNNDPFEDLAVGAPGENVGATTDAGAVNVFFGSAAGLTTSQTMLQDNPETGDRFGATLIVGFFDAGDVDLVVGAPGENVGATVDAGVANLFSNTTGTLPGVSSQTLLQDNVEAGDRFGAALTAGTFTSEPFSDLVVGAPGENVGATVDAGAANFFANTTGVLPGVSGPALLQDNPEAGDRFGAALTAGPFTSEGFFGSGGGGAGGGCGRHHRCRGGQPVRQPRRRAADASVGGVAAGQPRGRRPVRRRPDREGPRDAGGFADLVAGAPGEDVGATVDAGAANVLSQRRLGCCPPSAGRRCCRTIPRPVTSSARPSTPNQAACGYSNQAVVVREVRSAAPSVDLVGCGGPVMNGTDGG